MKIPAFQKKQLAIAILLAAPAFSAQAALIDLNLSASSSASADGNTAVVNSDGPSNSYAYAYSSDSAGSDGYGYGGDGYGYGGDGYSYTQSRAEGGSYGAFGANAYGSGNYVSSSTFLQSYAVTNDALSNQFFDFTFSIENGSMYASCADGYGSCSSVIDASYDAEIRLNGTAIWASAAEIIFDGTDAILNTSDVLLGTYSAGSDYYSWADQSFTIDLGTFAANEEFILEYEINLKVSGTDGYSTVQFGDPNGFGQSGTPFTSTDVTSVPEPGSLGIIAAGLGLLALRRRKNKTQH